jgi:hypothetical protein
MSAGFVLLVGAGSLGLSVHAQVNQRAAIESVDRTEISAVLLEASPSSTGGSASVNPAVAAAARWNGPDGAPHTGRVQTVPGTPAGTQVPAWVERDGTITTRPTSATDAGVAGVLVGFYALLLGGAVLVGVWIWVCRLTASVNCARWEREWAQVEPDWSGHVR